MEKETKKLNNVTVVEKSTSDWGNEEKGGEVIEFKLGSEGKQYPVKVKAWSTHPAYEEFKKLKKGDRISELSYSESHYTNQYGPQIGKNLEHYVIDKNPVPKTQVNVNVENKMQQPYYDTVQRLIVRQNCLTNAIAYRNTVLKALELGFLSKDDVKEADWTREGIKKAALDFELNIFRDELSNIKKSGLPLVEEEVDWEPNLVK